MFNPYQRMDEQYHAMQKHVRFTTPDPTNPFSRAQGLKEAYLEQCARDAGLTP